ncbi:MAG: PilZ domain-containing protein [Candidatus Aminicenantes bacterium]|nr:PilZ domain-containing protein [Candidatus Aminicenantes bacterium]
MTERKNERRESQRAFFTLEENIAARVLAEEEPGQEKTPIPVTLLSISIGGLSFLTTRYKLRGCKVGDRLHVKYIQTPPPLDMIDEVEIEIKYIIDDEHGPRIVIGGEYTDILQLHRKRIFDYVNQRIAKLGLNK